ncbi:hypothetical protein F0U61_13260 [Archangium violaceum]|uniref:hypothetical protein n=1 Tax=Archangium violaceum TaxID=83451 RepID=UPI002B28FC04|nr:hypothetical protein F0U61_13260 [Archangium violaceum]
MRTFNRWMALAVLVCGPAAYADRNDFEITKLGNPNTSRVYNKNKPPTSAAEFSTNFNEEANGNFRAFARTFAAVMTSANLMPPETLGHAGFALNAELSVISLPSSVVLPTEREQTGSLLLPSVHVRKGLPFSLELGARVGWIDRSSMFATTGELKWAANEGFTWLPDIGVRIHVTRLMGNRDFDLTATGLDLGVGKQFPLGGMVTLTPYGGIDFTGVMASSDTLDFDQGRQLSDTLDNPYAGLDNTGVYEQVKMGQNINTRFYGGVRFIGGALQLGAEFSLSSQGTIPVTHTTRTAEGGSVTIATETRDRALPAVVAFSTTLGLDF